MTKPGSHKIYLLSRKGFVKLALQYGCDLVPMVSCLIVSQLVECDSDKLSFSF